MFKGIKNNKNNCYLSCLIHLYRIYLPSFLCQISKENLLIKELETIFKKLYFEEIDLSKLLQILNLNEKQQDSLEFHKFFTTFLSQLLVKERKEYASKPLNSITGLMRYSHKCCRCFHEKVSVVEFNDLIILSNNLKQGLFELFANEFIDLNCACFNRNFIKSMKISALPMFLHFQINRFIFDGSKCKKSKNPFVFPLKIDMSPFVDGAVDCTYELCGVLLHQGSTVNWGHYVVKVFNREFNCWFNCNDEQVDICEELDFDFFNLNKTKKRSILEDGLYESRSCSLLLYRKW